MSNLIGSIKSELDILYEEHDERNKRIRQLEKAKNILEGSNGIKTYDPEKAAGPQAIEDVQTYLQARGIARQVEITKDLGRNSGTVSCALQVLEKRNLAWAGERKDRSVEWHWTGPAKNKKVKAEDKSEVAA